MTVASERARSTVSASGVTVRYLAAALAFASQFIHLWILPEAFVVTLLPGLFFLSVAIGQGLLGVSLLFGPGRWALRLGITLNLLLVAIWTITRFVSLPVLTGAAQLPVGLPGVAAVAVEITLVVVLVKSFVR